MFTGVESFEYDKMKAIDKVMLILWKKTKEERKEHGTVDLQNQFFGWSVSDENVPMSQVNYLRL